MDGKKIKLLLPSEPQSLEEIRNRVRSFIKKTPYQARASDILLVISEACSNVVRHAYDESCKDPHISVECVLETDCLTLLISDKGKGLSQPSDQSYRAPAFTENGGFGLFLMQKASDKFECRSLPGLGTVVKLSFNKIDPCPLIIDKKRRGKQKLTDTQTLKQTKPYII